MPDTILELCEQIDSIDSQSSLMKKAGPILRRNLIDALIRRVPYTYKEVFNHFKLGAEGISFTAFYYWARKVRRTAALTEMARSCSEAENPVELIPKIIAQRLLDASLDEDISVNRLTRLTHIYKMTSYVELARQRLDQKTEKRKAAVAAVISAADALLARTDEDADSAKAHGKPAVDSAPDASPSEISNPDISNSPHSARSSPAVAANPKFTIPDRHFPDPLLRHIPTRGDLPDPDPRREALRRRLRENFKPLADPVPP